VSISGVTSPDGARSRTAPGGRTVLALVAAACAATWIVVFYPGFMSNDSADQLLQARTGELSDWHPPVMSVLWRALETFVRGPFGMLLLQTAAFWTGLALLAGRIAAPVPAKVALLLALAVAPPIVSIAGAIWKDVLMVSFLVLACGLAGRRFVFWPIALLATLSRYNAVFAMLGVVLLHVAPDGPTPRRIAGALAATAALFAASLAINASLADRRMYPMQMFALDDLSAITARTGTVASVDPCHQRRSDLKMAVPYDEPKIGAAIVSWRRFRYCSDDAASKTLVNEWVRKLVAHPLAYASYRAGMARRLLGLNDTPGNFVLARSIYSTQAVPGLEEPPPASELQDWFGTRIWELRSYGVFRPWIYGLLGIVACALAAATGRWRPCFIAFSGLACELGLFVVAPSSDYRYSYWMIVSALIATGWLVAELANGARGAARRRS